MIARETGQPVLGLVSWTTRQIQFNSWDKMILPLPFSTIVLAWSKPVDVPPGLGEDDYERLRQEIEDNMVAASQQAEDKVRQLKERPATSLKN
ncbi:MAG: hypothetical protein FJY85_20300 [Deltaproteobacteria bacterium]|nr:hypothetical protein [Deltaproteobacteria bacterium]